MVAPIVPMLEPRMIARLHRRRERLWNQLRHAEAEVDRATARAEALIAEILIVGDEIDALSEAAV